VFATVIVAAVAVAETLVTAYSAGVELRGIVVIATSLQPSALCSRQRAASAASAFARAAALVMLCTSFAAPPTKA